MKLTIDHVAIKVSNIKKSIEWYSKELEAETLFEDPDWALLRVGDSKIALLVGNKHDPHVAFKAKDMSKFNKEEVKTHRDGVRYVYKKDPDGNCVEWVCY